MGGSVQPVRPGSAADSQAEGGVTVKAELTDGSIIEWETIPLWLADNEAWRLRNQELAQRWIRTGRFEDYYNASQAEARRLESRALAMEAAGIVRIIREEVTA